jgi:hypothetical protein
MGAVSSWRLQLPDQFRPFDYATISDVIFHIRYTARDGGESLRIASQSDIRRALNDIARTEEDRGLIRIFSLKQDFSTEWHRLTRPADTGSGASVELAIPKSRLPFLFAGRDINLDLTSVDVYAVPKPETENFEFPDYLRIIPPHEIANVPWNGDKSIGPLPGKTFESTIAIAAQESEAKWRLEISADDLLDFTSGVADMLLAFHYSIH